MIWTVHFLGVYLLSSAADVAATADDGLWRLAGAIFSLACLAGVVGLGARVVAMKRLRPADARERFELDVALGACLVGGVGIAFQSLPLLLV